jgi:hypothetical protein
MHKGIAYSWNAMSRPYLQVNWWFGVDDIVPEE